MTILRSLIPLILAGVALDDPPIASGFAVSMAGGVDKEPREASNPGSWPRDWHGSTLLGVRAGTSATPPDSSTVPGTGHPECGQKTEHGIGATGPQGRQGGDTADSRGDPRSRAASSEGSRRIGTSMEAHAPGSPRQIPTCPPLAHVTAPGSGTSPTAHLPVGPDCQTASPVPLATARFQNASCVYELPSGGKVSPLPFSLVTATARLTGRRD